MSSAHAHAVGDAPTQLCLLEPWVLWLTRVSELEDTVWDFRDPDHQLAVFQSKCAAFRPLLLELAPALLAAMTLGQVRPACARLCVPPRPDHIDQGTSHAMLLAAMTLGQVSPAPACHTSTPPPRCGSDRSKVTVM